MSGCFFLKHGVVFGCVFRTSWPKMGVLGGKIGEEVVRYWPPTNSFFLWGILMSVPILVKIDQEMRPWETHTLTDWFYKLSHAICYSCGTDNNVNEELEQRDCNFSLSKEWIQDGQHWSAFIQPHHQRWPHDGGK